MEFFGHLLGYIFVIALMIKGFVVLVRILRLLFKVLVEVLKDFFTNW